MGRDFKLIIFDCDGVLVDSEGIANRTFAQEVRKYGVPLTDEEAMKEFPGTTLAKCIEYVEEKFKVRLPERIIPEYRANSLEAFSRNLEPVPGVETILEKLKINSCVASNGPLQKMLHNLSLVNFTRYFGSRMYSAYDINLYKPDPGIFLHAARESGADPSECIVVEDSIHGFQAGLSAGMKVFGYEPHGQMYADLDIHSVRSMEELAEELGKMGVV